MVISPTKLEVIVVTAVDTRGDWITLSIDIKVFAFCFLDLKTWEVPIPTLAISNVTAGVDKASAADFANFTYKLSDLTAYMVLGSLSVVPTPTEVVAIPIALTEVVSE